jgi:MoaA/NifB/PqqE/SkfB family radical SAM enzyme
MLTKERNAAAPGHLRSMDFLKVFSLRTLWRLTRGMARAPFDRKYAGSPLAVCWFVNFECNARCIFCCKAGEIEKGKQSFPPLDLEGSVELLKRIRRSVDMLYISGGEPLMHPPLRAILKEARALRFKSLGMTSNILLLDRFRDVLDDVDVFTASIHGSDPETHAKVMGISLDHARKAFDHLNILQDEHQRSGLRVMVNFVINEVNLHQAMGMVELTRDKGFLLELVPANEHGGIPLKLAADSRYQALIKQLIALRKSGKAPHLAGSTAYYRRIGSFRPFRCFPYGVPNITPDGRLCTPCDVSEQYGVAVLNYPTLKDAVRASAPYLGDYPCSKGHCFKAGIIERSRLFGLFAETHWHE